MHLGYTERESSGCAKTPDRVRQREDRAKGATKKNTQQRVMIENVRDANTHDSIRTRISECRAENKTALTIRPTEKIGHTPLHYTVALVLDYVK